MRHDDSWCCPLNRIQISCDESAIDGLTFDRSNARETYHDGGISVGSMKTGSCWCLRLTKKLDMGIAYCTLHT